MERKMCVLLVDDEEDFAKTLAERLEIRGVTTVVSFDGTQALEVLEGKTKVDAVVLDVRMPGLSGLDVLKHIRATYPHIPVILLTGYGDTRDGIDGMRLGAFDYLMKPLDIESLLEKLREATGI